MPLASIQKVVDMLRIDGADNIELAKVLGWFCIVAKGTFNVGDLGVFIEIDSVVPDTEPFSFLKSRRIKTMRMRGVLSQGLLMPTWKFAIPTPCIGEDVTDLIGITKYEVPVPTQLSGEIRCPFPSQYPKTDEVRIQSYPKLLEELWGEPYSITMKYDGTSATFAMVDGEFHVCSRNFSLYRDKPTVYWDMATKYDIEHKMGKYYNLAIQGEIIGPGIQGNRLGLKENELRIFNAYALGQHYTDSALDALCCVLDLPKVDTVFRGRSFEWELDELVQMATDTGHEGIVARHMYNKFSNTLGGRISFKVVSPEYDLRN